MIVQDIIRGLKTETCPFCNKSMSCFADDRCYTCNRISYSKNHFIWKMNNIEYLIELKNSKIEMVVIETSNRYVIFRANSKYYRPRDYDDNKFKKKITENTDLEKLYKIGNQIIKEEIFK